MDFVPRTDLPSWYERVRVAVLTARYDNFPVAGLEAMAAGRPLVTTSKTCVAELSAERKPEPLSRPATPPRSPKLCARTSSTLHVRARTEDVHGM